MTEFGIFNDEGCVECGFYSRKEAEQTLRSNYDEDDELEVHAICHDHPEQIAEFCEECNQEDLEEE